MSDRPERAIRILLADASRITTMGIRQVIEKESDMEIIGVASDGEEAVAKTNELEPDVLVIEVDLPRPPPLAADAPQPLFHRLQALQGGAR